MERKKEKRREKIHTPLKLREERGGPYLLPRVRRLSQDEGMFFGIPLDWGSHLSQPYGKKRANRWEKVFLLGFGVRACFHRGGGPFITMGGVLQKLGLS